MDDQDPPATIKDLQKAGAGNGDELKLGLR